MTANFARPLGAVPVAPTFPEGPIVFTSDAFLAYRPRAMAEMLEWLRDRMEGVAFETREAIRKVAQLRAIDELQRPLRESELLVLASASRDFFFARERITEARQ